MNILITGSAGFIGYNLSRKLMDNQHNVIGVDDLSGELSFERNMILKDEYKDWYTFYERDISKENSIPDMEVDIIIHLAAKTGVRGSLSNFVEYTRTNVFGTMHILDFALNNNIKKFIFASTSSVYGNPAESSFTEDLPLKPISPYSVTKVAGEAMVHCYSKLYGMHGTCLRFFTVYGPWGRPDMAVWMFTEAISKDEPVKVVPAFRDMTYVDDIVNGIILAMEYTCKNEKSDNIDNGYCEFNLGSGAKNEISELVKLISVSLNKTSKSSDMKKPGCDAYSTLANISKAEKMLGYKPKVNLSEGISRFIRWYKGVYS